MRRLIKAAWYISILIFLFVLLWVYSYLPSNVGIQAGANGLPIKFVDKELIFYVALGLFLLSNIVIYGFYKLINLQYLKTEVSSQNVSYFVKRDIADWLIGFSSTINLFYTLSLIYLSIFNNQEGVTLAHYAPVVYAGPIIIFAMLIALLFILFKKRTLSEG